MGLLWRSWDFPGGLVVKSSPFNAGGAGSIPRWGAQIPNAQQPTKMSDRGNIVTNSIKTLKNGPLKKKNLKVTFYFKEEA